MVAVTKNKKEDKIFKILISETSGPIGTKLCLDIPWMTPFQNCVWQTRHPNKHGHCCKKLKRGDEI
jgi:hypothetical protein